MNASDVIRIGRSLRRAASTAAAHRSRPWSSRCLANSTIRIAFFAASPISTMKATCVRMLLSWPRRMTPVIAAMRHMGTMRITASGRRQALVLGCEHEEHEHDGERKREHGRAAGAQLLEGERRPLVAEALRQRLGRELPHDVDRLPLRVAGCGRSVELGGGIEIVARHAVGAGDVAHGRERAERHGIALRIAHADLEDVASAGAG